MTVKPKLGMFLALVAVAMLTTSAFAWHGNHAAGPRGSHGHSRTAPSAGVWYGGGSFECGIFPGYWLPPRLLDERPPYFSFYPPVYYSYPVAASYGASPYPRGASLVAAEPTVIAPLTVRNQYVQAELPAGKPAIATTTPLRITNPFVSSEGNGQPERSVAEGQTPVADPVSVARSGR